MKYWFRYWFTYWFTYWFWKLMFLIDFHTKQTGGRSLYIYIYMYIYISVKLTCSLILYSNKINQFESTLFETIVWKPCVFQTIVLENKTCLILLLIFHFARFSHTVACSDVNCVCWILHDFHTQLFAVMLFQPCKRLRVSFGFWILHDFHTQLFAVMLFHPCKRLHLFNPCSPAGSFYKTTQYDSQKTF